MSKRNLKNGAVSPEEFVRIWQAAGSVREVAKKTGVDKQSVEARAVRYRRAGVPLKKFDRGHATPLDIARLKRIAEGKTKP